MIGWTIEVELAIEGLDAVRQPAQPGAPPERDVHRRGLRHTDEYVTGSAASPTAITVYDGARSYRDVSALPALPANDAFPDRFVKITKSVCFGDSGGPLFHGDTFGRAQHVDVQLPL